MSANLISLYAQEYATNIALLLQQKESRLRGSVSEKTSYKGEQASPVDQVGAVEMQEVTERFAPISRVDAPVDRRWVSPTPYELPQLVDTFDELKMVQDPKGALVANAVAAVNRQIDRTLIAAFFASAKTGKTGTTTTAFLSANIIANTFGAASATGLTVAKLRQAKKILLGNEVDIEGGDQLYCGVTAKQHDDLLAEIQVISKDYNDSPVLVEGMLKRFLGFEFRRSELYTLSSTDRLIPAWAKSGMHLGMWQDQKSDISQRKDITALPWQIYHSIMLGATRLEEKKVIKITCSEA